VDYDQAIQLDPTNAALLNNRGLAKLKNGDAAGGNADIAKAKQLDPQIGR
jgi:Flp pilus assembly protein TadD